MGGRARGCFDPPDEGGLGYQNQNEVVGFFRGGKETFESSVFETMKNALFPVLSPRATLTLPKKERKNREEKAKVELESSRLMEEFSWVFPGDGWRLAQSTCTTSADGAARGTEHNLERSVWASKVSLLLELFQEFPCLS